MDTRYNGYRNFETFTIHMEIHSNTSEALQYWQDTALETWEEAQRTPDFTKDERARLDLADILKTQFEEQLPHVDGWPETLMHAAFERVDWMELAEELLKEDT